MYRAHAPSPPIHSNKHNFDEDLATRLAKAGKAIIEQKQYQQFKAPGHQKQTPWFQILYNKPPSNINNNEPPFLIREISYPLFIPRKPTPQNPI